MDQLLTHAAAWLTTDHIWLAVGFLGQFLFGSRFLIQWFKSELAGRSVIPISFWLGAPRRRGARGARRRRGNNLLNLDTFFDAAISAHETAGFNCGLQTESVIMKTQDLITLVQPKFGHFSKQ